MAYLFLHKCLIELWRGRDAGVSLDVSKVKGSYTPKILGRILARRRGKCEMDDPIYNFMCTLLSPESRRLV
jgi:hypothetical protein